MHNPFDTNGWKAALTADVAPCRERLILWRDHPASANSDIESTATTVTRLDGTAQPSTKTVGFFDPVPETPVGLILPNGAIAAIRAWAEDSTKIAMLETALTVERDRVDRLQAALVDALRPRREDAG